MNQYEQAGLVFYSEKNYLMASNMFSKGLEIQPDSTMLWYGLGDSLCHISIEIKQKDLYPIGLSCVKKSYSLDSSNQYASKMLERMKNNPEIGFNYIDKLTIPNLNLVSKFNFEISDKKLISYFKELKSLDSKVKLIIHLGETKNIKFYSLLKYCVLKESNQNIRFAALKRIPYFKSENIKEIFDEIISRNEVKQYEPYFSIALSSIDENWTTKFINPEFANLNNEKKSFTKEEIEKLMNDEEIKAIVALSLVKYDKGEIQNLFEKRNHKTIAFYLTNRMNDDGINILLTKQILNRQGGISEIGWKHIEEFLKIDFKKSTQNPVQEKKQSEESKKETPKKWWEIWK